MLSKIALFILRPFAKPIRYGALKIMKKFRQPDDERPIMTTADHILGEMTLPSVFEIFREKRFRELADFKKLPVSEHDRIFNELESAGICLVIFCLRSTKATMRLDDCNFWQKVEDRLLPEFQKTLINHGVEGGNAKLVKQLIEMRYEEYEKLRDQVLETNNDQNKQFIDLSLEMKRAAALLQAIAIGTVDHIRRGEIREHDLLIKYLMTWLLFFQRRVTRFIRNL